MVGRLLPPRDDGRDTRSTASCAQLVISRCHEDSRSKIEYACETSADAHTSSEGEENSNQPRRVERRLICCARAGQNHRRVRRFEREPDGLDDPGGRRDPKRLDSQHDSRVGCAASARRAAVGSGRGPDSRTARRKLSRGGTDCDLAESRRGGAHLRAESRTRTRPCGFGHYGRGGPSSRRRVSPSSARAFWRRRSGS